MNAQRKNEGKAHLLILLFIPLLALSIGVMKSVWATLAVIALGAGAAVLIYRKKSSS